MNEDVKKYLYPAGAGLLGLAGIYGLLRAPIWGAKSFEPLRKKFGSEATIIISKETEKVSPFFSKILSGFDKTIVTDATRKITPSEVKGFTIDTRSIIDTFAHIKPSQTSMASKIYPGHMMSSFSKKNPSVFPETTLLEATDDMFMKSPEHLKEYLHNATKGIDVENTILKPGTMGSKLFKVRKTKDVLNDPTEFYNELKKLEERQPGLPLHSGKYNAAFYLQKEVPGETYRATLINENVVPGSVVKRHNMSGAVLENTGNIEKHLSEKVKKVFPFENPEYQMFNPDFQVVRDASGNVMDIKIVDLNWGGAPGNVIPNTNPVGSWALSRALTGKQPRVLAAIGGGVVGGGAAAGTRYFTKDKKKEKR